MFFLFHFCLLTFYSWSFFFYRNPWCNPHHFAVNTGTKANRNPGYRPTGSVTDPQICGLHKASKRLCSRHCWLLWAESGCLSNPDSFTCLQFDPDLRAVLSLVHGRIIPLFLPLLTPVPLCGFHFLQTKLDCSHFHHQTTAPSLASSLLPEYKRKTAGSPAVKQYSESHGSYRFIVFLFRRLHSVKSFEHQSPWSFTDIADHLHLMFLIITSSS